MVKKGRLFTRWKQAKIPQYNMEILFTVFEEWSDSITATVRESHAESTAAFGSPFLPVRL
jgi:hypothetical protein